MRLLRRGLSIPDTLQALLVEYVKRTLDVSWTEGIMASNPAVPPPIRWLIGIELARHREEARMSLTKAAQVTGVSKPKISHLELGNQTQSAEDISRLLSAYGAEQRSISRLTSLATRADEANWWMPWADVVPPWFRVYVGLERLADRAYIYEPVLIHGLLQTPDYARAVAGESLLVRADHINRIVEFRAARAARLSDPDRPLRLDAVITAAALDKVVGPPEVYEAQLMHLAKLADLAAVTIQVLPPEAGPLAVHATGGFALLDLDANSKIGYVELLDDAVYLYDRGRLQTYEVAFNDLQRAALDPERSLALIRSKLM
jgi:transcriptional regulator with XRE-family HTH domain